MPAMQTFLGSTKLKLTEEEVFPGLPGTKWWVIKQVNERFISNHVSLSIEIVMTKRTLVQGDA